MRKISDWISNEEKKEIYELIRNKGPITKIELLELCNMNTGVITRHLEELVEQQVIINVGFGDSARGRKPILYETNPSYGYVFGLEISRINCRLYLYDLHLRAISSQQWLMTKMMTPQNLLPKVIEAVHEMLIKHSIPRISVIGMGICAVGPLDKKEGKILNPSYFSAPQWENIEICKVLQDKLNFQVLLDNGPSVGVQAEYWLHKDKKVEHLCYVLAGVSIATAMMSDGKLLKGAFDLDEAIGQMIIQTDGPQHEGFGNYGSLESYATIPAIEKKVQTRLKQGRISAIQNIENDPEKVKFFHLVQALHENDPLVLEVFTQSATYFGIGLANLINLLHPEKVILGGPLIYCHPLFFDVATKVAIEKTYFYPTYNVVFSKENLGEEGFVSGAALMVIKELSMLN
ncbi:ROK family transcriptional regulator [Sporosarcina sp. ACRSM]|uniref:ROK family transcriptional regulator n=1 Tax=Sporosarcina sp. ACRSM TaxID=2918216 RepID=UPI001EF4D9E3|nr:ROK family transcriptional regulator [Sporosarcina sp. ACRSM]MCG7335227.1 ROK family transcriptional regulator [Sporosarcina sp. ACRSM]